MDDTLSIIAHEVRNCTACPLGERRMQHGSSHAVPGDGSDHAPILFLGAVPTKYEADTGFPFVGKSGVQLRRLLSEAGINPTDIFITHLVCCRTAEGGDPSTEELETCMAYTERQIELIDPDIIVPIGRYASSQFLGPLQTRKQNMGDLHGIPCWSTIDGTPRIIFPMYHPAAGIWNESLAPLIEEDFGKLGDLLRRVHDTEEVSKQERLQGTKPIQQPPALERTRERPETPDSSRSFRIVEHTSV